MTEGVFERLRGDHRRVLAEVAVIEASVIDVGQSHRLEPEVESGLRALLELLERQFATHMQLEEGELYPRLAGALPETRANLAPLSAEHDELRLMLTALRDLASRPASDARDEQLAVQVRDLAELLRIHIRKEEAVVFSIAERVLDAAMMERLSRAYAGPVTSTPPARDAHPGSKGNTP